MSAPERLEQDAAAWVARLSSDRHTEADRQAFRGWIEGDPARARAYAKAAAMWDDIGALASDAAARELLWRPQRATPARRLAGGLAGLAATAAAVLAAVVWTGGLAGGERLGAAPGRIRTMTLADGSSVVLDGGARVRASFTPGERRIVLERGRAFFRVAKDPKRPFRVFVGQDEVRAIGTAFQVRRLGDRAVVVLEEGRLAVFDRDGGGAPLLARLWPERPAPTSRAGPPTLVMTAGEEVRLGGEAPPAPVKANLAQAAAWRYGRLILDETPLDEVAAELTADGGPRIVLSDPRLAQIRVSGVFHRGHPREVVSAVAAAFPVQVAEDDSREIVLAPR